MDNLNFSALCVFQSLPADVASIISSYSDFRLGLLSRPLRLAWELEGEDKYVSDFYFRPKAIGGDDLFAIVSNNGGDSQQYNIKVYFKGKLYSTFPTSALCSILFDKRTILAICDGVTGGNTDCEIDTFTSQVFVYNIDGLLMRKFQIKTGKNKISEATKIELDDNNNIILKYCEYPTSQLFTYCINQGTLLQSTKADKCDFTRNKKGRIFSVDNQDPQYFFIQKHDNVDVNKIIAEIPIQKRGTEKFCFIDCCVSNHPEKLLVMTMAEDNSSRNIKLVDFDNPQVLHVVFENPPSFIEISVGPAGKITAVGWGFVRCYE